MREALLKKRFGVPALLLISILLTAGSATAIVLTSIQFKTNTAEPLSFSKVNGLNMTYLGESDDIKVTATNENPNFGYGIFVNNTLAEEQVDFVKYSTQNRIASEPLEKIDFNGDGDMVDAKYNINPSDEFDIVVTIHSAANARPGELKVTLEFLRESKY